jgi:hypothetical protein
VGCWHVMPSELEQLIPAVSAERSVVTLTLDPVVLVTRSRHAGSSTHRLGGAARRATGSPAEFRGDVITTSKQDSAPVTGWTATAVYTVFGKLASAPMSLQRRALPLGLAHGAQVLRDVAKCSTVFGTTSRLTRPCKSPCAL